MAIQHSLGILQRIIVSSFAGIDEYYIRVAVKMRRENEKLLEALKKILGKGGDLSKRG